MRRRQIILIAAAMLAIVAVARQPTADIEILTHQVSDASPHRMQVALDLGVVAVKFLLTWTASR